MTRWAWWGVAVLVAAGGAVGCGSGSSAVGTPDAQTGNDGNAQGQDVDATEPGGDGAQHDVDAADHDGSAGGQDAGAGPTSRCPASPPANGAVCSSAAGACTYADNPRPACRTMAVCAPPSCSCGSDLCQPYQCPDAGSHWAVGSQWASQCTPSCPPGTLVEGAACTQLGAYCPLADGTPCGCFPSDGGMRWTCVRPPTDPQCPKTAPPVGSPCTDEGLACGTYDVCVTGSRVVCRGGVWIDNEGNCPY